MARASKKLVIPTLTDDMRASFPAFVDEWTAVGRSTEPMDRVEAAAGMVEAYAAAGLAAPRVFFGVSPMGGALMRRFIVDRLKASPKGEAGVRAGVEAGVRAGVGAGVGAGVWSGVEAGVEDGVEAGVEAGVGAGVWAGVWAGVEAGVVDGVRGVWDGVGAGVRAGVWAGVWDGVWDGVWAGVGDGVGDGVWAGVGDGVGGVWPEIGYGCHDAGWLSFYDWFRRHGMAQTTAPLLGLTRVARSSGWHWLHRGFVVISDRPSVLHDERVTGTTHRRRLHCATGPSVAYRDDWALWHWHGTHVPRWAIEADDPVSQIAAERNTEIRRCAIERYGWDRYLDRLGVTPVSVQPDPGNPGHELRLYDLPRDHQVYGQPVRLLVMDNASRDRDGTRRRFAETVPADVPDAVAAAAWQFGVDAKTYAQLERAS